MFVLCTETENLIVMLGNRPTIFFIYPTIKYINGKCERENFAQTLFIAM